MTAERITQIETELAQAFKADHERLEAWEAVKNTGLNFSTVPPWPGITKQRAALMAELRKLQDEVALEAAFTVPFAAA